MTREKPEWYGKLRSYALSRFPRALLQTVATIVVYICLWALMILSIVRGNAYVLALIIALPCAFAHIRIFILFHDCCHGSLFPSRRANILAGHITGILTFTNYETWRRSHLKHHATNAQLDHRGTGDVWTMTVREYQSASGWTRFRYRLYRNPLVMFLAGPIYLFVLKYRFSGSRASVKERISTMATNAGLVAIMVTVGSQIGFPQFISLQLPVLLMSGMIGIWLFYIQHQFDPGYWSRDQDWDEVSAAFRGSSYYDIPRFFQWTFGHIGIHHLHHLLPRIPNYNLRACYEENREVQIDNRLSVRKSLSSLRMKLWHEAENRFVSFRQVTADA